MSSHQAAEFAGARFDVKRPPLTLSNSVETFRCAPSVHEFFNLDTSLHVRRLGYPPIVASANTAAECHLQAVRGKASLSLRSLTIGR
jgi:hypothetical protein